MDSSCGLDHDGGLLLPGAWGDEAMRTRMGWHGLTKTHFKRIHASLGEARRQSVLESQFPLVDSCKEWLEKQEPSGDIEGNPCSKPFHVPAHLTPCDGDVRQVDK